MAAPLHALTSLSSHPDHPTTWSPWSGAAHSEHCPGQGQSGLRDLPSTFLWGMFPHLSTVLIRLQSAWTALLLTPFAKNKLAVPAPSGPCLCRNCGNQWEFFFYSPSLSSSAEQATSTNLTCHFPQEVLKGKDRSIFYTNCNGNGFVCNRSSGDLTCWFLRFWYIK